MGDATALWLKRAAQARQTAADMAELARAMYLEAEQTIQLATQMRGRTDQPVHRFLAPGNDALFDDGHPVLLGILDAAITLTDADMGNIQLLDNASRSLRIIAQRGFQRPFLDFFDSVHHGEAACGAALKTRERIVIKDVTACDRFGAPALETLLDADVRGVQSTPLIGSSGQVLGVVSTHYHRPRLPKAQDLYYLDRVSLRLAALVEMAQGASSERNGNGHDKRLPQPGVPPQRNGTKS